MSAVTPLHVNCILILSVVRDLVAQIARYAKELKKKRKGYVFTNVGRVALIFQQS